MLKTSFVTPLTSVETVAKEGLGSIRFQGGKWYKYVLFQNTTATVAGAAGSLVGYYAATGYTSNRVVADLTDADGVPFAAGATLAAVTGTLTVAYYCWIQIKGAIVLDTSVTNGAAGAPFYLSTTDKTGVRTVEVDSGGAVKRNAGISYNTTTGVVLDCPF